MIRKKSRLSKNIPDSQTEYLQKKYGKKRQKQLYGYSNSRCYIRTPLNQRRSARSCPRHRKDQKAESRIPSENRRIRQITLKTG